MLESFIMNRDENLLEGEDKLLSESVPYILTSSSQQYCKQFQKEELNVIDDDVITRFKEDPLETKRSNFKNTFHDMLMKHLIAPVAFTNTRAINIEYLPQIRRICQFEDQRKQSNTKRRFTHYLSKTTLDNHHYQSLIQSGL